MEHASSASNRKLSGTNLAILAAAAILAAGFYLGASAIIYRIGFPLDDSWIHLTYARNMAQFGQWAFQLGHPSAGSTAPLWTFLLAVGFWLRLGPYVWTYLLGGLTLFGLAVLAEIYARRNLPAYTTSLPWIGLFFVLEWHLCWAAMSGMETLLHAFLVTAVLISLMGGRRRYLTLGVMTGLSVWVRPDGMTLAAPVLLTILLTEKTFGDMSRSFAKYLLGFGALLVPYLLLNLWLSGTPMPNTFYAKQTEYAAWQAQPLLYRLGVLLVQMLTGPGLLLLPGAVGFAILQLRRRAWPMIAAALWCAGYLLLYILRLPAYQHGRYLMPAMPIFFLFGLSGYFTFLKSNLLGRRHWAVAFAWQSGLLVLTVAFLVLGARSFGDDVGLIESEMVVTAKWAATNLPANAVIAAHDIGALGYFDHHRLIDLAGLVSPQVVHFMRDEKRLSEFLDKQGADYLIAFPAFYPTLTRTAEPVFASGGRFAPAIGEQNMTIYRWHSP